MTIYADHNATSPLRPEAREAMLAAMDAGANPSSVHAPGRAARKLMEAAREDVGGAIGVRAQDLVFTSGGTEANALALIGAAAQLDGRATLLISALEHESVANNAARAGVPVELIPATAAGLVDLDWLRDRLARWEEADGAPLLSLMLANNETGVIQPVAEAATLVRERDGLVHCDAVQGLGKIPVNPTLLGADYLALSAHKCGGPHGVGALYVRPGAPLKPQLLGGGQERSVRSGTENLSGIAGFGAAARAAVAELPSQAARAAKRDAFEAKILAAAPGCIRFGAEAERLPNTSCFALPGFKSEIQVMSLDLAGRAISAGSACSSGKVKRSGVLSAMGVPDAVADCAIRTSYGWNTDDADYDAVAEAWIAAAKRTVLKESA
ncbi:MAG: cysteine desulfurase family protein [Pseudomonadota bacterium]